jgi:hypothetical protein
MKTDQLACSYIIIHVAAIPCQQPCHRPRKFTRHHHVSSYVILHVIIVWHGNWICDKNYTICDVNFRHRKRAWVGLRGARDFPWRFYNVMDQAIYDKNLKNVTRCDLWRSIHDVIWYRHRYCFMTVFQWSVTKFNRHGSTDFL